MIQKMQMIGMNIEMHAILLTMKSKNISSINYYQSNYYKEACIAHKEHPSKLWNTINEVCSRKPERAIVRNLEISNQ